MRKTNLRECLAWLQMYNQMLVGILVFQLTYIGILSIKKFPYSVLLFIPTIVTICWAGMVQRKFGKPLRFLAVHTAADLDRADLVRPPGLCPSGSHPHRRHMPR